MAKRTADHNSRLDGMLGKLNGTELAAVAAAQSRRILEETFSGTIDDIPVEAERNARDLSRRAALLPRGQQTRYCEAVTATERANLAAAVVAPACSALLACRVAAESGAIAWAALETVLDDIYRVAQPVHEVAAVRELTDSMSALSATAAEQRAVLENLATFARNQLAAGSTIALQRADEAKRELGGGTDPLPVALREPLEMVAHFTQEHGPSVHATEMDEVAKQEESKRPRQEPNI